MRIGYSSLGLINMSEVIESTSVVTLDDDTRQRLAVAEAALAAVEILVIEDNGDAAFAADQRNGYLRQIDQLEAKQETLLKPFVESMAKTKEGMDGIKAEFRPGLEHCRAAVVLLNTKIKTYAQEQKQLVDAKNEAIEKEARRIRWLAEEKATNERIKAAEEAAQIRLMAEESERKVAQAREAGREAEAKAAETSAASFRTLAAKAEEEGARRASLATLEGAVSAPAKIGKPASIAGNQMREHWVPVLADGVMEDQALRMICEAIVKENRSDLLGLLEINTTALNALARGLKTAMRVPGYFAHDDPVVAGSRKR